MSLRDLLITGIIFGLLPFVIKRPWIGCLLYVWVSVMNPHRMTWGFAYEFPFAMIVAVTILLGLLVSTDRKKFPVNSITVTLLLLAFWMNVTMLAAIEFQMSIEMWDRVMKNLLMLFVAFMVLHSRKHVDLLVWVLVFSIGFFSVKGGLFTIATGGQFRVWGPPQGVIYENNSLAVATIMIIPLMRYLQLHASPNKWVSRGFIVAMGLSAISALGSQSRGGFLAAAAMGVFFWWKSRHKFVIGVLVAAVAAGSLAMMSEQWEARMRTIETYQEDGSAQGRLIAWGTMFNLAKDRPLVGGGFHVSTASVYARYGTLPGYHLTPVAHSIYFQMMGEHGFVGLGLFLLLALLCWRYAGWIMRQTRGRDDLRWAHDLAAMVQVSLVAYGVGGAFLNMAHFELPYYMALILVLTRGLVAQALDTKVAAGSKIRGALANPVRVRRVW